MKSLEYLAKEDPAGYFTDPVDLDQVPGYRDVVSLMAATLLAWPSPVGARGVQIGIMGAPLCVRSSCAAVCECFAVSGFRSVLLLVRAWGFLESIIGKFPPLFFLVSPGGVVRAAA